MSKRTFHSRLAQARSSLTAVVLACASSLAAAATVDLAAPASSFFSTAVGDSRSVVLRDDTAVALTSLGVRMDPALAAFSLTAQVYAFDISTGLRGALLATGTQAFTDLGLGFYDVGVAANLVAGDYYELNMLPFGFSSFNMEFYNFNGPPGGGNTPYAAGPVTVSDGCGDGNVGGCGNSVLAHFRIGTDALQAVPEPGTAALAGLALVGLAASRRRR